MQILRESGAHLKRDLIFINYEHVVDNLQEIANILSESVKNRTILKLTRSEIEDFLADVSDKVQTCYLDCLHLRCH